VSEKERGEDEVRAAGGVVHRERAGGDVEVLLVHRPRYDDWSLPKGKLEPGESPPDAARREVAEETGIVAELAAPLPTSEYVDRHGRSKVVYWWRMTPVGTVPWAPSEEVDVTRWLSPEEAATLLTYAHDRRLVESVTDDVRGGAG
jgi:8-oxo-dGTP diphosphatase